MVAGVGPSFDGGFDSVRLLQISTCLRACLFVRGGGGGGGELSSSIATSPGGAATTKWWHLTLLEMSTPSRRCVHFVYSQLAIPGQSWAPSRRSWRGFISIGTRSLVPVAGWPLVF